MTTKIHKNERHLLQACVRCSVLKRKCSLSRSQYGQMIGDRCKTCERDSADCLFYTPKASKMPYIMVTGRRGRPRLLSVEEMHSTDPVTGRPKLMLDAETQTLAMDHENRTRGRNASFQRKSDGAWIEVLVPSSGGDSEESDTDGTPSETPQWQEPEWHEPEEPQHEPDEEAQPAPFAIDATEEFELAAQRWATEFSEEYRPPAPHITQPLDSADGLLQIWQAAHTSSSDAGMPDDAVALFTPGPLYNQDLAALYPSLHPLQ